MADQLISLSQAARMLGISRQAMHKKVAAGHIPALRIGKMYAVEAADVRKHQR